MLIFSKAKDKKPPFNAREIADLIVYYELYARIEQPEWRKKLIAEHGPAGVSYDGYNNYENAALWEWNWSVFGHMPIDKDADLKFNGKNFTERKEDGYRRAVKLEEWLIARMKKNDPKVFDDGKWKYKKIWLELIKIMEVISFLTFIASLLSLLPEIL